MKETDAIDEYILQHIDEESDYLKALYRDTHVKLLRTGKNKHEDAADCLASLAYFIEGNWSMAKIEVPKNPFRGGYRNYGY